MVNALSALQWYTGYTFDNSTYIHKQSHTHTYTFTQEPWNSLVYHYLFLHRMAAVFSSFFVHQPAVPAT